MCPGVFSQKSWLKIMIFITFRSGSMLYWSWNGKFIADYIGLQTLQCHIIRRPLRYWNRPQIMKAIGSPRGCYTVGTWGSRWHIFCSSDLVIRLHIVLIRRDTCSRCNVQMDNFREVTLVTIITNNFHSVYYAQWGVHQCVNGRIQSCCGYS